MDKMILNTMQLKAAKAKDSLKTRRALLISFEGLDGSGKSTQFNVFRYWLSAKGYPVVTTKWKSSPLLASHIKRRKQNKSLNPEELSLLHIADFFLRLETIIIPSLNEGKLVLCDRYAFTSLARDAARGIDAAWILDLYRSIVWPDLVFYFSIDPEVALQRITTKRNPKYYEAGQDITKIRDPGESYKAFAVEVRKEYEALASQFNFNRIDATLPIEAQQRCIRRVFQETMAYTYQASDSMPVNEFFSRANVP